MHLEIPVTPDADTAREWARDELAKPEYSDQGTTWFESFLRWVQELFDGVGALGGSLGPLGTIALVLLAVAAVAVIVWLVLGPLRRSRRTDPTRAVFDDDSRSSQQIRDAATAAERGGDWDLATMEWFRASVRLMEERRAISDSPGVTAHEAATRIESAAPALAGDVAADAMGFDLARYGSGGLTATDAGHARTTCEALADHRQAGRAVAPR
ncbi:DUF4129 domain-containing protein [Demequina sp. SO4-13]|uniref:DUF4129 domain-containing protein n=1 Tax=Demequina sp. SO4-13 TaxID=3401027 RepID=UPI003AF6C246